MRILPQGLTWEPCQVSLGLRFPCGDRETLRRPSPSSRSCMSSECTPVQKCREVVTGPHAPSWGSSRSLPGARHMEPAREALLCPLPVWAGAVTPGSARRAWDSQRPRDLEAWDMLASTSCAALQRALTLTRSLSPSLSPSPPTLLFPTLFRLSSLCPRPTLSLAHSSCSSFSF